MPTSNSNHWTTDPDYIELINYIIERTENVETPMNAQRLAREFKEKSGAAQSENVLKDRIYSLRTKIHSFEHIDTNTKVRMMFALSASVNAGFLTELKKNALVKVDEKKRITHYKANDGHLELRGDHSQSAKRRIAMLESKGSLRSLITDYFEKKNDADAIPQNEEEKEMGNLIEFITEKCVNVDKPLNICQLIKDFKNHFGISVPLSTIRTRVEGYCREIQKLEFLDTQTKVQQLFGLSAIVDSDCLKELRKNAQVEVDDKKRIIHYKANDESLELRGDHSRSAKTKTARLESKQSIRSWTIDYFENKNDSNAVPENEREKEIWKLIEFITEKCENINTPLKITRLATDFINHFGISKQKSSIEKRVKRYCREIQTLEFLDTHSKVRQLFGLSATVDPDYLEKLRKEALVNVDEKNRIVHYKANDGGLELKGDHSQSKRNYRDMIIGYFENWKDADAVSKNEEEREMWNFIGFIIEKCENFNSPLNITHITVDFYHRCGVARSLYFISKRVEAYCREIQALEFLDTPSKVRQLFCLSATLESECLKELRKDAVVEVDNLNRITKYTANDGRLTLHGDHSSSAKQMLALNERKKKQNAVKNDCNFEDDEMDHSEGDNDEYSGEEFDFEDDNNHLDKSEDHIEPSNEVHDDYNKNPCIINSPRDMSIDDNFDFDPPTERSQRPEETEIGEDDGRKRKNSSLTASLLEKKRNKSATESSSSNWTGSFSNDSMRPNELDDYCRNCSFDDHVKLEPFRGSLREDLKEFKEDEDIQQIPKPPQAHDKQNYNVEVSIKVEPEGLKIIENPTEDVKPEIAQAHDEHKGLIEIPYKLEHEEPVEVKPETSHSSKNNFFKAMKSLIVSLDTPSLSWVKTKIHQKIQKLEEHDELILNNEIFLTIELLIARIIDRSEVNLSESIESVNLSNFLCYLKAAILNSKMNGVEGLVQNISKLIEESHNKTIPMENVANALRATLDIDGF